MCLVAVAGLQDPSEGAPPPFRAGSRKKYRLGFERQASTHSQFPTEPQEQRSAPVGAPLAAIDNNAARPAKRVKTAAARQQESTHMQENRR